MAKQYSIAEARDHLTGIVHEVEKDGPIELTRRGKPVAAIVSIEDYRRLSPKRLSFSEAYEKFRQSPDFEPIDVDEVYAGVRDKSPGREFEW